MTKGYTVLTTANPTATFHSPALFLLDWRNWDAYLMPITLALLTWTGDILVVRSPTYHSQGAMIVDDPYLHLQMYCCWIVWQRSYRVVIVPLILFLVSLGKR